MNTENKYTLIGTPGGGLANLQQRYVGESPQVPKTSTPERPNAAESPTTTINNNHECLFGLPDCNCRRYWAKDLPPNQKSAYKDSTQVSDDVDSPSHYNTGAVECIEGLEACLSAEEFQGYLRGNAMKYLWRCSYKGSMVKDLKKATWYIERLVEKLES